MKSTASRLTGIGQKFIISMRELGLIEGRYYEQCMCGPSSSVDGEEEDADE